MIMKGQKISDRYQIVKQIGEGGMANVYLAYDTILERDVAIKILRGDLATDEKFVRRFQREALAASSLSHPNIVEVYDVGEDKGEYYIVMEYIEGKHLKQLLKKRGKLTLSEVIDIMSQLTDGMSVAHDSYIIHRDIKPQNIMILENGLIKITDFGIAMALNSTQLTQTNSVMGSVHYLPPEQANGKGATLKSDIYSMGILMYELLTGKLPYRGDTAIEVALKQLKEPLPSIKDEVPNLPQSVENIIIKATAKNPKNRYQDAREMHNDLVTCLDESRANEKPYKLPYPELDPDDVKIVTHKKEKAKEEDNEEKVATQINESDYKKDSKVLIILAAIFTGLVLAITVIAGILFFLGKPKEVVVPDVSGLTVKEAIKKLQDANLKVNDVQKEISSDKVPEGSVVKTIPEAGTKKTKDYEITLYVSLGDTKLLVEDYTGRNASEVTGELKAHGIYTKVEKQEVDDTKNYNDMEIIGQDVEPGTKLSDGDTITLYIPDVVTVYPDFTSGSYILKEVEDFCTEHKINLNIEKVFNADYAEGTIIYQSKPAGYTVTENTSLTIKVSTLTQEEIDDDDDSDGIID
ncbi:MAG: Stk1 family PASTA domain-containing Ser/Thr kinase [Bacilli bacterium]|nr:Stk1 family PASTA domain-containing Ser/Thr kinase [Bacilli bacterium]